MCTCMSRSSPCLDSVVCPCVCADSQIEKEGEVYVHIQLYVTTTMSALRLCASHRAYVCNSHNETYQTVDLHAPVLNSQLHAQPLSCTDIPSPFPAASTSSSLPSSFPHHLIIFSRLNPFLAPLSPPLPFSINESPLTFVPPFPHPVPYPHTPLPSPHLILRDPPSASLSWGLEDWGMIAG